MPLLYEILALLSIVLVVYLAILLLFEPGPSYRVDTPMHGLDHGGRLALLATMLASPVREVRAAHVLREGDALYETLADLKQPRLRIVAGLEWLTAVPYTDLCASCATDRDAGSAKSQ